jgi:hypothetical protein
VAAAKPAESVKQLRQQLIQAGDFMATIVKKLQPHFKVEITGLWVGIQVDGINDIKMKIPILYQQDKWHYAENHCVCVERTLSNHCAILIGIATTRINKKKDPERVRLNVKEMQLQKGLALAAAWYVGLLKYPEIRTIGRKNRSLKKVGEILKAHIHS